MEALAIENTVGELRPIVDVLVSQIDEGVILSEPEGMVVCSNPAARSLLGLPDGIRLRDLRDLGGLNLQYLIDRAEGDSASAGTVASEAGFVGFEQPLQINQEVHSLEFRSGQVHLPGKPGVARLTIIRDVSDRNRLRAVLDPGQRGTLVTQDSQTLDIISRLQQIGPTQATVLIQGESGTGKTQIARLLHKHSPRAEGPLVEINCAAIPETLIESELFGHVKGAFTGALEARQGRFQSAHGGTLLLDEVGELPLHLQAKLLRVLQDHRFEKVGSDKSIEADVRVIAASNRNLRQAVDEGAFRADLYYRLAVIPISVPPLRERPGDIPLLIRHFHAQLVAKGYADQVRFGPEALQLMMNYGWPGNVRELSNAVEHGIICAVDNRVLPSSLPQDIRTAMSGAQIGNAAKVVQDDRQAIVDALDATGGNRAQAARRLGIDRSTLWRRMNRLGIETR